MPEASATIWHLLNRAAFGPAPGDMAAVAAMGTRAYLAAQLDPQSINEDAELERRLKRLRTTRLDAMAAYRHTGGLPLLPITQNIGFVRLYLLAQQMVKEAQHARLMRAVESKRQLLEVMVDFWFNHFNISVSKDLTMIWANSYEQEAIRPHALGRFRDLLGATAQHPAMLFYLDNWLNTAPDSPGAQGDFTGYNENYARELMELHTLGVDGGYTQQDVLELARILTGWGINNLAIVTRVGDIFMFDESRHDFGAKTLLGLTFPEGRGAEEVEQALDLLASHPSTAHHIATQLGQYFVADQPPQDLVAALSQTFLDSQGDIKAVLGTLFNHAAFWENRAPRFPTPYQWLVGLCRALGWRIDNPNQLLWLLVAQGMDLYDAPQPNGYTLERGFWFKPDALLARLDVLAWFTSSSNPMSRVHRQPPIKSDQLFSEYQPILSDQTKSVYVAQSQEALKLCALLGGPEWMMH